MPYRCDRFCSCFALSSSPSARLAPRGFLIVLFSLLALSSAIAADDPELNPRVSVGFDGVYKVGFWTPVEVELGAIEFAEGEGAAAIEIVVPDGDGIASLVSQPITALDRQVGHVRLLVKFGRINGWIKVRIRQGEAVIAERRLAAAKNSDEFRPALPVTSRMVIAIGRSLLPERIRNKRNALQHLHIVELPDARQLPEHWIGYTGIDGVLMTTAWLGDADVATYFTPAQIAALDRWVRLGGQLVLSVGGNASTVLARRSPLATFAPGRFEQVAQLPLAASIENYVGSTHRLESEAQRGDRLTIPVARLVDYRGDVELSADEVPIVIRLRRSLGNLTFVGVDLSTEPFSQWNGQADLVARVLGPVALVDRATPSQSGSESPYDDISGQLRGALDQFEGVAAIARFGGLVFGLIALYALVVGPLDYLLVGRLFGRGRLTWFTFPMILVLACGAAYALIGSIKGREPKVNQVDLVDIDAETGVVRGWNWTHAYSPASGEVRYDFHFDPQPDIVAAAVLGEDFEVRGSWMGLPGSALGGMDPVITDTNQVSTPYGFSQGRDAMFGVPIPASSSKSLIARWYSRTGPLIDSAMRSDKNGGLYESSSFTWNAEFELPEAYLFHDRWVYRIGVLRPGDSVELKTLRRRSADSRIKRHRVVDGKEVPTRLDPSNLDVTYVVEAMMFHAAAGGADFAAGLRNQYMQPTDMSQLLRPDVAILVGRPKDAILKVDFQPAGAKGASPADVRHTTFMRVVLPVEVVDR